MSDCWINIIPKEPQFVPTQDAQTQALAYMKQIVGRADEVTVQLTKEVRFVDCGENFERATCPACGADVDIEWWKEEMERQFECGYTLEPVELPCCSRKISMAALSYDWPQGYARFSVEAMNPEVPDLTSEQIRHFEALLGCAVIKVLQHI